MRRSPKEIVGLGIEETECKDHQVRCEADISGPEKALYAAGDGSAFN